MNRLTKIFDRLDSNSDNALMMKVRDGDLDKLGLLFERYNLRLFGFFYRLTHRRDISEDLVQGVFERILKYRESYKDDGAFSTFPDRPKASIITGSIPKPIPKRILATGILS